MAAGDIRGGQRVATALFHEGRATRDERKIGKALLLRAQTDVYASWMQSAARHATRAVELFRSQAETSLELHALATQSYAQASLGLLDKAREGATRCRSLAGEVGSTDFEVLGANYAGVTDFWAADREGATTAFRSATELAERGSDTATLLQSLTNWCFSEVLALQRESLLHPDGERLDQQIERVFERLERLLELQSAEDPHSLVEPEHVVATTLANAMQALAHLHAGDYRASRHFAWTMREYVTLLPRGNWLRILPWWYDAESARRLGKAETSKSLATRMRSEAGARSHRPMQELAGLFLHAGGGSAKSKPPARG